MTPGNTSLENLLKNASKAEISSIMAEMPPDLINLLKYDWEFLARPKQRLPAGDWDTWLIKTGRGFGKTRAGAETTRIWARDFPIIHIVGPTAGDARDIMIEGESGILAISPDYERPHYSSSNRRLTWPNGSKGIIFSADEPDRLRGPQCYKAWADELASWRYPDAWDQLQFGLRLGSHPQSIVTTTPRPTPIIKALVADARTVVVSGSTYENKSNLAESFLKSIERVYGGTRLGRQEIHAELLADVEGALWTYGMIDYVKTLPEMRRIVVAVDPATTADKDSDETGIVVVGLGMDGLAYVLDDLSGILTPNEWGARTSTTYHRWQADRVVAETNQGGDMVETIIRNIDPDISYRGVHASKGKVTRAEPVSALYEQKKVKHYGSHAGLESQMTSWDARTEKSPDRVDALVWGLTELMLRRRSFEGGDWEN